MLASSAIFSWGIEMQPRESIVPIRAAAEAVQPSSPRAVQPTPSPLSPLRLEHAQPRELRPVEATVPREEGIGTQEGV